MPLVVWISLVVGVVAILAGLVLLAKRALESWRAFRSLRRSLTRALGDLTQRVAGIETRLAHASSNAAQFSDAQVRLRRSLATAAVLADAAGEAGKAVGRLRGFIPRK